MPTDESKTRVTILTGAYRIKGNIDLPADARLTDYMVQSKEFIAVTDVEVWEIIGRQVLTTTFLNVNRDHIQIIAPGAH